MRPLAEMPRATLAGLRGILTDIDDTLSTDGRIDANTYAALEALHRSGLIVIPVTGRPAGWCDHIARMWPVDGVVGENGAFYMRYDACAHRMQRRFIAGEDERRAGRTRLSRIAERVLREVPGAALASDQAYRESDIAIDYREDVAELPAAAVDRIVALLEDEGLAVKVSSIHVNAWEGSFDKLTTVVLMLREVFDIDLTGTRETFVFVGDSPNDAPMFSFFPNAVGVANVARFADRMPVLPAYVTGAGSGAGFVELANAVLASRA